MTRQTKIKFTERLIKDWTKSPEHDTARDYFDADVAGLVLKVQPTGKASFCLRYRFAGQQRRLTLGTWPGLSLEAARKAARTAIAAIADGRDPAAEKQAARRVDRSAEFYPAAVELFIRKHAMIKNRGWRDAARVLGLALSPISARQLADPRPNDPPPVFKPIAGSLTERWATTPVKEIRGADVAAAVQSLMPGAPAAANARLAHLKSFFAWLTANCLIDEHPCEFIPRPADLVERDRVLSADEIRVLWATSETLSAPYRQFVRVLALTGQRRSEVAGMRWAEIAGDNWVLPGERAKNGKVFGSHTVPLSDLALAEINSLPRLGEFIFTTHRAGETSISCFSDVKLWLDGAMTVLAGKPLEPWTLHDLRRTAASGMGDLGVQPHIIEAVLNHKSGVIRGIARVYNRATYEPEKRQALGLWASHVAAIVGSAHTVTPEPSNVVALTRTA